MSHRSSLINVLGRSLATHLDRLRHTLDGLGQRLRESVARAVGETLGGAVRQTLHAALADDDLVSIRLSSAAFAALRDELGSG